MVSWLIRLLLVALLIRLVMNAVTKLLPREFGRTSQPGGRVASPKRGALVRDPICGTYVEPSHALSVRSANTVIYFCSEACRQAFQQRA